VGILGIGLASYYGVGNIILSEPQTIGFIIGGICGIVSHTIFLIGQYVINR
jgi:hypothetical protein